MALLIKLAMLSLGLTPAVIAWRWMSAHEADRDAKRARYKVGTAALEEELRQAQLKGDAEEQKRLLEAIQFRKKKL